MEQSRSPSIPAASPSGPSGRSSLLPRRGVDAALAGLLGLAVLVSFSPVLWNGFVNWDDDANLLENPAYRGLSPRHLRWMFTTFHMGNYQPLTWISLGLDYDLWGMNPAGYHLTNLLLHAATTLLFYRFLLTFLVRTSSSDAARSRESARWPAAIGALLFALHPLRVESVAWATERKDVLCGFFVMLTMLAYLRMEGRHRTGRPSIRWLLLSLACFIASLLSKALGLMLPLVLLVLDVGPLRRFVPGQRRRVILEKVPFLAAALIEGVLTYWAIGQVGLVRPLATYRVGERLLQAAYGLCFYVLKTLVPVRLSPLYPIPHPFDAGAPAYGASLLGVALLSTLCVAGRRRIPASGAAWLSYVLLLVPVLGLINDAPHIAADRYSYLACLPWPVLWASWMHRRNSGASGAAPPVYRQPALLVSLSLILVLGTLTFVQSRVWRDSIALWNQALSVDPLNSAAYNNRGIARSARNDSRGALSDFSEAIRLYPEFVEAFYNRGRLRMDAGDLEGAIADESEAIRLSPEYARAYRGRGLARQARGDLSGAGADLAEAKRIEAALLPSLDLAEPSIVAGLPSEIQALNNEGNRRASQGDFAGAIPLYSRAIALNSTIAGIYNNRGNARASTGDQAGAVGDYSEAIRLDPQFSEAFANRGMSHAILGDVRGAQEDYSEALRLAPRDPDVLANRGMVRTELGDRAGAASDFEQALAVAPPGWSRTPIVRSLLLQIHGR